MDDAGIWTLAFFCGCFVGFIIFYFISNFTDVLAKEKVVHVQSHENAAKQGEPSQSALLSPPPSTNNRFSKIYTQRGGNPLKQTEMAQLNPDLFDDDYSEEDMPDDFFAFDSERTFMVAAKQCVVRQSIDLDSKVLGLLRNGEFVTVDGCCGRRGHLTTPIRGWASIQTKTEYTCLIDVEEVGWE